MKRRIEVVIREDRGFYLRLKFVEVDDVGRRWVDEDLVWDRGFASAADALDAAAATMRDRVDRDG
jgi:hypothetical protein